MTGLWMSGYKVIQIDLADTIFCERRIVRESREFTMEPLRANPGSVFKAHTSRLNASFPIVIVNSLVSFRAR